MTNTDIYKDIAARCGGAVMIGVVGPVRTGKSTFIKRFMDTLVIPNIEDEYARERARDELPQSGSGKTIMTAEPKFVPEEAAEIRLGDDISCTVRMVDCVGYMVSGAAGMFEDGAERMVTTPWFDHEVTMTEAAETGTHKVICDHSTIGLVVTTDGSICDIERELYAEPERRVVEELQSIGKPFIILLNSAHPDDEQTKALADKLSEEYSAPCLAVSCISLTENDMTEILRSVLGQFPISSIALTLPDWFSAVSDDSDVKQRLYALLTNAADGVSLVADVGKFTAALSDPELIKSADSRGSDLGSGVIKITLDMPRELYYAMISAEAGVDITDERALIETLKAFGKARGEYESIKDALASVRQTGYGVIMPRAEDIEIDEPQLVKQNGRYAVKLRAHAPAVHLFKTGVEAAVSPSVNGDGASEEILSFLLQSFDGDMSKLWESNIFGRPLSEIARDAVSGKIGEMPQPLRARFQETLQRAVNEGRTTLICLLL